MHEPVQFNFQRQKCLELNYTQSLLYKFNLRTFMALNFCFYIQGHAFKSIHDLYDFRVF